MRPATATRPTALKVPFKNLWRHAAVRRRMDAILIGDALLFAACCLAVSRVGLSISLLDVVGVTSTLRAAGIFGLVTSNTSYTAGFIVGSRTAALGVALLAVNRARRP
jgi:hypothetical protein